MSGIHQILLALGSDRENAEFDASVNLGITLGSLFGAVCKVTASKALVVYTDAPGSTVYAVVLTVTAGVISAGTPVAVSGSSSGAPNVVQLDSSSVLATFATTVPNAVVLSIVGTTITVNTPVVAGSSSGGQARVDAFSSTHVLLSYNLSAGGIESAVLSVSGVTITVGAADSIANANGVDVTALSDTIAVIAFNDTAAGQWKAATLTRSGTTLSRGANNNLINNTHKIKKLTVTNAVAIYSVANVLYAALLTISGSTITESTGAVMDATAGSYIFGSLAAIDQFSVLCAHGSTPKVRILFVDGPDIASGPESNLPAGSGLLGSVMLSPYEGLVTYSATSQLNVARIIVN